MTAIEINSPVKNIINDSTLIIQEYEIIIENLQQDLGECQIEQARLRKEIEALKLENKTSVDDIKDALTHVNTTGCPVVLNNQECIENLKKQISIINLEKESIFQLWQTALKKVESLEQVIKAVQGDGTVNKLYEQQLINVKKTETIQVLEAQLTQVRDNFIKHQVLWESSKEKLETLKNEKNLCEKTIANLQKELSTKEESNLKIIESLKAEINTLKQELDSINKLKIKLENELIEARHLTAKMTAKDQESKEKVAEALELIEIAVREKEAIMEREVRTIEEKSKLENRLTNLSEEFAAKLDKELTEIKENFEKNSKKYVSEIKELKAELREKATLVDRVQREYRMLEEEIEKSRIDSQNYLLKSNEKVLELERKLKETEYKLNVCEDECKQKYEEKLRQTNHQISDLENKLSNCNDKLRRNQVHNLRNMEEMVRDADDRTKEAVERYSCLEKRLARALDDKENYASEMRELQIKFDKEITRRNHERQVLKTRIEELQEDLKNSNDLVDKTTSKAHSLAEKIEILEKSIDEKKNPLITSKESIQQASDMEKLSNHKIIREQYEEKISELTKYVKIHQQLSNRWKEEAQSLASKFYNRYKELRSKLQLLKDENTELKKELTLCRQQVIVCRSQLMQRLDQDDER
ncbi:cingulin-like [Chelonus insularis]|uniref:cingulin-like n=1 Tax=Chelonus insularis TaxID=460826 RepID=UPI001588CC6E|nr:cingulin-like [Chelonus insularis]